MLAPFAIQRGPLPDTNFAPGGDPKIGVVVHVIEGSADSAMWEFHSQGAQLSAHFVVSGPGDPYADGTIFQLLDTDLCAYAQAAGNYPPTAYIAVEFSGTTETPMSNAQVLSGAQIVAWASQVHGFPVVGEVGHGTPGVTTHCNPDGSPDPNWGDHPCPGPLRLAQVPAIVFIAQQVLHPTPPAPPSPPQENDMSFVTTDPPTGRPIGTDANGAFYGVGTGEAPFNPPLVQVGLNQHPEWKAGEAESAGQNPCIGIVAAKDADGSWGYTYITEPTSGKGSWGPYNRYHVNRNGTF